MSKRVYKLSRLVKICFQILEVEFNVEQKNTISIMPLCI